MWKHHNWIIHSIFECKLLRPHSSDKKMKGFAKNYMLESNGYKMFAYQKTILNAKSFRKDAPINPYS